MEEIKKIEKLLEEGKQIEIRVVENCDCGDRILHNNGGNYHMRWSYIIRKASNIYEVDVFMWNTRETFPQDSFYKCWCGKKHREDEEHYLTKWEKRDLKEFFEELKKKDEETVREINYPYREIKRYDIFWEVKQ